jgi:hypothetical protein
MRFTSDRGDIILGWLTKLVVVLGVAGLFLFDAISLGTTAMNLSDQGSHAARQASEVWQTTKSVQKAYEAAVATATEQNAENVVVAKTFRIDEDNTVHFTIKRTANSILLFRWDKSAEWAKISREAAGRSVG